jgi:hypothetical protein
MSRLGAWSIAAAAAAAASALPVAQEMRRAALAASAVVEQSRQGDRAPLPILEAFDGLGADLHAGDAPPRNPSDNSLAIGPDHIVQTVNSQVAIFTKKGARYDTTGRLVYGPVSTNTFFTGFGEVCSSRPNGDVVVRFDQLARRWLVVMPIFRRAVPAPGTGDTAAPVARPGEAARAGQASDPGPPARPGMPPAPPPPPPPRRHPPPTAPTQCAMPSARQKIPSASTTAMCSIDRCSPTTRDPRCGLTGITCPPARATT